MKKIKDITGERFGRWLVVGFHELKNGKSYWKCVCDCGAKRIVDKSALNSGSSKSCGCYNRERVKKSNLIDISGNRYGKLVVLEYFGVKNKITKWKCICDCVILFFTPKYHQPHFQMEYTRNNLS